MITNNMTGYFVRFLMALEFLDPEKSSEVGICYLWTDCIIGIICRPL